jgi:parallel beta-helix repeat protein
MKHKTHHLYHLFYPRNWIIIALLMLNAEASAQESTPEEFLFGAAWFRNFRSDTTVYNMFRESGMNFLHQYADTATIPKDLLEGLNFAAYNGERLDEWIQYYSTAYYSKWEAEENQQTWYKVGFKHKDSMGNLIGSLATYLERDCWSTEGLSVPACSLVYGPHYHQEKVYKRWPDKIKYPEYQDYDRYDLRYTPRYVMALKLNDIVDTSEVVCKLYVKVTYREANPLPYGEDIEIVLKERTLRVSDFAPYDTFKTIYLGEIVDTAWYKYPLEFRDPQDGSNKRENLQSEGIQYFDRWGAQGVQFCIDWLRNDDKCTLYVDYVEVYDNDGGDDFANDPQSVIDNIVTYAQSFPQSEWPNMKYWGGPDEPSSLDDYIPMKIVDSVLNSIGAPRLLTKFYPWWEGEVNGDVQLVRYYNTVQPEKLFIDFFPFLDFRDPAGFEDWETTRKMFQICHSLQPGFYYMPQVFGMITDGEWHIMRFPDTCEVKAQTMLALAHGVKGLVNEGFTSLGQPPSPPNDIWQGILNEDGTPFLSLEGTNESHNAYKIIKDNLVPRLKGTLGKALMSLNYTGDYLQFQYEDQQSPSGPAELDYLTLDECIPSTQVRNWHCGFFTYPSQIDNEYFLLANMITTDNRCIKLTVRAPENTQVINYRFRNIEGIFDTTFNAPNSLTKDIEYLPGEGYVYQVAPVILYGGKLIFDETISSEKTLIDDMIIKNGKTLTVNTTYNIDRSIIITEGGRLVTTTGGTVKFYNDQNLIIEGTATIAGTPQNKLVLDFLNPAERNGIVINPGGSLTIINCEIKNAGTGIFSELNANYLSVQNVDFINCADYSINIAGRSPGMNPTPPPQIYNCLIQNSDFGISVTNLPGMLIQENTITNTAYGIYLSNVTDAQVIANIIESNREEMAGIYGQSSGGVIRANMITGHTFGIHLANSSPKLGGNTITSNKYHGLYIGAGSLPFMRGEYVGDPPNMYALSGYNEIMENGGYQEIGGPPDNDGSEIYFFNSNAQMDRGCNSIVDDRQVSPPLINTLLLMNGYSSGFPIIVQAQNNFWGDTVYAARFGNLTVNYVPYESVPCPVPQEGGEEELVLRTSFGEVIDTVYSTGEEVIGLSATELAYAEAEGFFLTGDLTNALQVYEGIISSTATEEEKYLAYQRKYSIGKLTGQSTEYFNQLSNVFASLSSNTQDTLSNKILSQFSTLSKVGEQEYETAITEFDNIVQQNPNTEEAVYAEIDALTTALLIEEADSTLQKGRLGKYLIKSTSDYNHKIDEILRKHFGSGSKETEKELLPTEYTLYQNYPNPFNPTTTIKYDLPTTSDVSLIIYDILGRKIKELVNTKQQAGKYEVQFDASNLASGVYIYQLIAQEFVSSKKMILLK